MGQTIMVGIPDYGAALVLVMIAYIGFVIGYSLCNSKKKVNISK